MLPSRSVRQVGLGIWYWKMSIKWKYLFKRCLTSRGTLISIWNWPLAVNIADANVFYLCRQNSKWNEFVLRACNYNNLVSMFVQPENKWDLFDVSLCTVDKRSVGNRKPIALILCWNTGMQTKVSILFLDRRKYLWSQCWPKRLKGGYRACFLLIRKEKKN